MILFLISFGKIRIFLMDAVERYVEFLNKRFQVNKSDYIDSV
jgi:hypothetical protein